MPSSSRFLPARLLFVLCIPGVLAPGHARARPSLFPAIVVGFHVMEPGPGDALQFPRAPEDLKAVAPAAGTYDVWLFVFTRAPLVGAWSLNVGLSYDPGEGRGLDILSCERLSDEMRPHGAWPAAGEGNGAEFVWNRQRCWERETGLTLGRGGWWYQAACRLKVRVYDPDVLALANPEPGVLPAEVECMDEGHDLDGSDNWTAVVPARFEAP